MKLKTFYIYKNLKYIICNKNYKMSSRLISYEELKKHTTS